MVYRRQVLLLFFISLVFAVPNQPTLNYPTDGLVLGSNSLILNVTLSSSNNNPINITFWNDFVSIDAGTDYSCGILTNGSVICWGYNRYGQLGDGSTTTQYSPVYVNTTNNFTTISAGSLSTCGILTNGSVMCWGYNSVGQLGDGTTTQRNNPVYVNSTYAFVTISAGNQYACGILTNGSAMCWGNNGNGQLGIGNTTTSYRPTYVNTTNNFTAISAGYYHTCGILTNGSAMCWGYNGNGAFGNGNTTNSNNPIYVNTTGNFTTISAGYYYTCGILTNGSAMCWGYNGYGQLGDGTSTQRTNPIYINTSNNFTSISANAEYTCGILTNGSTMCWGYSNYGQLGDGSNGLSLIKSNPVYVNSTNSFTLISAGYYHICGIITNGSAYCWGLNTYGQLGYGLDHKVPVPVNTTNNFTNARAGYTHSCGVLTNGTSMCWGNNSYGQLGDGSTTQRANPVYVNTTNTFLTISVSGSTNGYYTCGILTNYTPMCWGDNTYGQLGDGTTTQRTNPVYVNTTNLFINISLGDVHTCGIISNGSVMCWGMNGNGRFGNGASDISAGPNPVYTNTSNNFTTVSAGYQHTCGVLINGSVMCWGANTYNQLGDGTTTQRTNPVYVNTANNFTTVSAGYQHTCGILTNGTPMCWGYNSAGQLGDGTTTQRASPVYVNTPNNFTIISAAYAHTCGILTNGSTMCWGDNTNGQLGDDSVTQRNSPIYVNTTNLTTVSTGYQHTCGVLTNNTAVCWGYNYYGQLGDGTNMMGTNPVSSSPSSTFLSPIIANQSNVVSGANAETNWSGLVSDTYLWRVSVLDGNSVFNSLTWKFSIDLIPPSLTLLLPANTAYTSTNITLNYTVSDQQACWYSLNGGTNTTLSNCTNTTITALEGSNTITIYANDSVGNLNSSTSNFTVTYPTSTPDQDSPASKQVSVSVQDTGCPKNIVKISTNEPIQGLSVKLILYEPYGGLKQIKSTDSNGEAEFDMTSESEGEYQLVYAKEGYEVPGNDFFEFVSCPLTPEPVPECSMDSDCEVTEYCNAGNCAVLTCICGNPFNHICISYQCCANSDCSTNQDCKDHVCAAIEQPPIQNETITQDSAETTISETENIIAKALAEGKNITNAQNKLNEAKAAFAEGNFVLATKLAKSAASLVNSSTKPISTPVNITPNPTPQPNPSNPPKIDIVLFVGIAVVGAIGVATAAFFILPRKKLF